MQGDAAETVAAVIFGTVLGATLAAGLVTPAEEILVAALSRAAMGTPSRADAEQTPESARLCSLRVGV